MRYLPGVLVAVGVHNLWTYIEEGHISQTNFEQSILVGVVVFILSWIFIK